MIDPVGVAGLALAIIDELLTIGEKTAEVISDIRSFDETAERIYNQIEHEVWKTTRLKRFLFVESEIHSGLTLIEQFDGDGQDQIYGNLVELRNVLGLAKEILIKTFGEQIPSSGSTQKLLVSEKVPSYSALPHLAANLTITTYPQVTRTKSNKSPLQMARWSLFTKKQATETIDNFTKLNLRLTEKVQFLLMASKLGVQLQHLEYLETNADSIDLGFNDDAALKLVASDVDKLHKSAELDPSFDVALQRARPIEDRFATFEWNGIHLLQEKCVYVLGADFELNPQTRNRINALAALLQQPKEQLFCILRCEGWRYIPATKRIMYLFHIPANVEPHPQSLLKLLSEPSSSPSLGIKFKIAHSLARSIAQLHMVEWVHESLRSENVLFFPNPAQSSTNTFTHSASASGQSRTMDLKTPWIFGFEFSRPDSFFSNGFVDVCPERDVYRHPQRQGQPLTTFKKIHDIYAFGVLLLEIGVWRPVITLERNRFANAKNPYSIQSHLIKHAQKHLENSMGERYRDMTLKCLSGNFGIMEDTREDMRLQEAFRAQVVDVLYRMYENV